GTLHQLLLEAGRPLSGSRHPLLERVVREVAVAEDRRELVPQAEDTRDQGTVVVLSLAAARRVRDVDLAPERAVVGVLQDRFHRGVVEREEPAFPPPLARLGVGAALRALRNSLEARRILDQELVRGGGIEEVLAEALLETREFDVDLLEARLPLGWKVRSRAAEAADGLVEVPAPESGEGRGFLGPGVGADAPPE